MEFDELQSAYLKLQEDLDLALKEKEEAIEQSKKYEAENGILRENNQKLFERGIFAQQPIEEKKPEPQGIEAIKNFLKEGK